MGLHGSGRHWKKQGEKRLYKSFLYFSKGSPPIKASSIRVLLLLHCPKVTKSLGLFFQKPWKTSTLLKSVNSLRSNSTDFLRNALVFHPAERLLTEMATRPRNDKRLIRKNLSYCLASSFLNDPYGSAVAQGGSRRRGLDFLVLLYQDKSTVFILTCFYPFPPWLEGVFLNP